MICPECGCHDVIVYNNDTAECQECGFTSNVNNFYE